MAMDFRDMERAGEMRDYLEDVLARLSQARSEMDAATLEVGAVLRAIPEKRRPAKVLAFGTK